MTQLKTLLRRNQRETTITKDGVFSDWTLFAEIDITGGALQFTEARVIGLRGNNEHECFEIPVKPGKFTIECRVAKYGADARIASMRAYPNEIDAGTLSVGKKIKELPVDLGGIAVVDIGTVHKSMNDDEDALQEWYDDVLYGDSNDSVAIHTWKPTKTKIPRVESGFGDGSYPLFPLQLDKTPVGLLIEFIEMGAKYPF
jgi:hypothetical protein